MKKLFSVLLVGLFVSLFSTAQAQTPYEWDDYQLKFTVPAGFKETASTDEKFEGEAKGAKIHLFGLYPLNDNNITNDNLIEALTAMAAESKMTVESSEEIEFNGFEGAYAEGTIEGVPAFFACMLDPNGDLNFIVTILHENTDAAFNILKSIKKK